MSPRSNDVLVVDHLSIALPREAETAPTIRDVSFTVRSGGITGIVGETGSGKTLSTLAVFGILPKGCVVNGRITFQGEPLEPGAVSRRPLLGRKMAMVFQDARSSLHPTFSIGRQLDWAIKGSRPNCKRGERRRRALELLSRVGLDSDVDQLRTYPHELSGGMCQRIAIAVALAWQPELLVADEPTSSLDPTIQMQIADLLDDVVQSSEMSCLLVTHDIRLVRYLCDDVAVFSEGRVVERGPTSEVLEKPQDNYTKLLLRATV